MSVNVDCLVQELTSQVNGQLSKINSAYQSIQNTIDRKVLEAAKAKGLLDFPLAQKLLASATKFLTSNTMGVIDKAGSYLNTTFGKDVLGTEISLISAGSVAAVVGSIATAAGSQLQGIMYGALIESLKTELRVRLLYYNILSFHLNSLLSVLHSLQTQQPSNLYRLQIAYGYIVTAQKQLHKFTQTVNPTSYRSLKSPLPKRVERNLIDLAFNNVASAQALIKGDTESTKRLLSATTPKDFAKIFNEQFDQAILAQAIYMFETIAWNLARMAALVPIPFAGLTYTAGSVTLPGVTAKTFSPTQWDTILANLKSKNGVGTTISNIDAALGLLPTNILADQLMNQLVSFEVDWTDLQGIANTIVTLISPAIPMVDTIKSEMQSALENKDSEIILMGKEAKWLINLEALEAFKQTFIGIIEETSVAVSNELMINTINDKISKYQDGALDGKITSTLVSVFLMLPQAPFNNRALIQSQALCKGLLNLITTSTRQNTSLLNTIASFSNLPTTAASRAFNELLGAMKSLPAPASTIATALQTGQVKAIVAGLNPLVTMGGDIVANITQLGAKCGAGVPGTPNDSLIDEVNVEKYARKYTAASTVQSVSIKK